MKPARLRVMFVLVAATTLFACKSDCEDLFNQLTDIVTDANLKPGQIAECRASPDCSQNEERILRAEFDALRAVYADVHGDYIEQDCYEPGGPGEPVPFPNPGQTQMN